MNEAAMTLRIYGAEGDYPHAELAVHDTGGSDGYGVTFILRGPNDAIVRVGKERVSRNVIRSFARSLLALTEE